MSIRSDGKLWLLRCLQVTSLVASLLLTARFLVPDAVWVAAIAVDVVAIGTVIWLYRDARRAAERAPGDAGPERGPAGEGPRGTSGAGA